MPPQWLTKPIDGISLRLLMDRKYHVLIADDSAEDRFFLRRCMERDVPRLEVVCEVGDGEQVSAYLSGQGAYADRTRYPYPDLLLLDWRMPRADAVDVLHWLRARQLPALKVAVMASQISDAEKETAMSLGVSYFYGKVPTASESAWMLRTLETELDAGRH
jgi:CheY-like chemotaxis protein